MENFNQKLAWLVVAMGAFCAGPVLASYSDGVAAYHTVSLEEGIRYWREAAWRGDFLSETRLADIYSNASDTKYYDPVEAYVWYFLASRNRIDLHDDSAASRFLRNSRRRARAHRGIILADLDSDQRTDARNRIVYILACRGAEGFIELGHIHDTDYDHQGWEYGDSDHDYVGITSDSVMTPNDSEALIYFHIAESMGDPLARMYLNDLEGRLRHSEIGRRLVLDAAHKFHSWTPAYEFYPPGDADSGIPYTDECPMTFDRARALALVDKALPRPDLAHALYFLGWGHGDIRGVQRFQLTIGAPATGRLSPEEEVRLIQIAAVRGDAGSQNALGVMYAKGIGVARNFVRAQYWFQKASDQRYGAAIYHLGVLYKVGPEGIKQDLSRANDCFTAAALAGFRPALNQLGELLARAADQPPKPGNH